MKISELIAALNGYLAEYGDLDVATHNDEFCCAETISGLQLKEHSRKGGKKKHDLMSDDDALGDRFVRIE